VQRGQHQGKLFNILGLFFLCLAWQGGCLCVGNMTQLFPRSRTLFQELPRNTTKLYFVSLSLSLLAPPHPLTMGPILMPLQLTHFLSKGHRGLNQPGSEANHLSQFTGEFKIVRMYTSISPHASSFRAFI
jgi:hypothetical protein